MDERVALVTGASRGIGRATAVALASEGAAVAVNHRASEEEAKQTLALVEEAGSKGIVVRGDVAERRDVDRLFDEIESSLGPVGILVNNAGTRADGLSLTMSDEKWDRVVKTNLYGTFACCRRALKRMVRNRFGRIVNVSSIAGLRASPGQANYAAAKAGVIALSKTMAREVATKNITINVVAPGLINTELTNDLPEDRFKELQSKIAKGEAGTPEDVAGLIAYLASDKAAYITGQVFVVDGGMIS